MNNCLVPSLNSAKNQIAKVAPFLAAAGALAAAQRNSIVSAIGTIVQVGVLSRCMGAPSLKKTALITGVVAITSNFSPVSIALAAGVFLVATAAPRIIGNQSQLPPGEEQLPVLIEEAPAVESDDEEEIEEGDRIIAQQNLAHNFASGSTRSGRIFRTE